MTYFFLIKSNIDTHKHKEQMYAQDNVACQCICMQCLRFFKKLELQLFHMWLKQHNQTYKWAFNDPYCMQLNRSDLCLLYKVILRSQLLSTQPGK